MSCNVQMLGWENFEMVRASRSNRCRSAESDEWCDGNTLIATVRSRRESRARYTSPIPPAPTGLTISYGPSLVPEESDTVPRANAAIVCARGRLWKDGSRRGYDAQQEMYGPPLCRKRKTKMTGWSAQMYSAFVGAQSSWP